MSQEERIAQMLLNALNEKENAVGPEIDPYIRMANALQNNAKSAQVERMDVKGKERQIEKLKKWSRMLKAQKKESASVKKSEAQKKEKRNWWPVWVGGMGTVVAAVLFLVGWPQTDQWMSDARQEPKRSQVESVGMKKIAGESLVVSESDQVRCTAEPERMEESGMNQHTAIRLDCQVSLTVEELQPHVQLKNIRNGMIREVLLERRVDGGFLLTPLENLDPGSIYRLTLETEVERVNGRRYGKTWRWAWQTEGEWKADSALALEKNEARAVALGEPILEKAEASDALELFLVFPEDLQAGDQPILKFGARNAKTKEVEYEIHAPSLGMNHQELKALGATPISLAIMPPIGNHEIAVRARAGDEIAEERGVLHVGSPTVDEPKWKIWNLKTGSVFPEIGAREWYQVFFAEEERAKWQVQWGQMVSDPGTSLCAYLARGVANEEAGLEKERAMNTGEAVLYQKQTGGFAWEPHLTEDVFASAWAAILHPENLDREKLASVLEAYTLSENSFVRRAAAHAGLVALGHPSLQSLYRLAEDKELLGAEGLAWVDRGLRAAGADSERETLYKTVKKEQADAIHTEEDRERMCNVLLEMRERFAERERVNVSVQYAIGTESKSLEIPSGDAIWMEWTEKEITALKILKTSGSVAGVFKETVVTEEQDAFPGTITRSYWSDRTETQSVTDSEEATAVFKLAWKEDHPSGCLKITDYLPAGMQTRERPAENPEGMETDGYVYAVTKNEIQFVVCGTEPTWKRTYAVTAIAPGRYTAPPPKICLIQSPLRCWRGDRTEVEIGQ